MSKTILRAFRNSYLAALVMLASSASGQLKPIQGPGQIHEALKTLKASYLPYGYKTYSINGTQDSGRLTFQDNKLWLHNDTGWVLVGKDLPSSILDSVRISNDTLFFRNIDSSEIAIKLTGIKIPGVVGLQDSLSAQTLDMASKKGNTIHRTLLLDAGGTRLDFNTTSVGNTRIRSLTSGGGSFIPLLLAAGGTHVSNRSGSPLSDDGVSSLQVSGLATADTVRGITSVAVGYDWKMISNFGSWQLKNTDGSIPLFTYGSSGIGIDGGLTVENGNMTMDFGGTVAPRFLQFTNFNNSNQFGVPPRIKFLAYDTVSNRVKVLAKAPVDMIDGLQDSLDTKGNAFLSGGVVNGSTGQTFKSNGTLTFIGNSIDESYGATTIADGWTQKFATDLQDITGTTGSQIGITNFSDPSRYGITFSGTTSLNHIGPIGNAIQLTPGAKISFTGSFNYVDFWYRQLPGAGFIDIYKGGVLYRTIDCSGSAANISTFEPVEQTPGISSGLYELECRGANVTITAIMQLIQATSSQALYFQRTAKSGISTSFVLPHLSDVKEVTGPTFNGRINTFLIDLATNNIYNPDSATTSAVFGDDLAEIFAALKDENNNVIFVFPPKASSTTSFPAVLEPYENYLTVARRICDSMEIQMVDLSKINFETLGYYTGDGLHPNDAGHAAWAKYVAQQIAYPQPSFGSVKQTLNDATSGGGSNVTGNSLLLTGTDNPPAAGKGLSLHGNSTSGTVDAYDFDGSTPLTLKLNPSMGNTVIGGKLALGGLTAFLSQLVLPNGEYLAWRNAGNTSEEIAFRANGSTLEILNQGVQVTITTTGSMTLGGISIVPGTGSPEGVVTAPPGSFYLNKSGGAGTTLYVKESGSGNTGWIAK